MTLYDILKSKNYYNPLEPKKYIDKLSNKYTLFNFFHKTQKRILRNVLMKGNISIYFDIYFDEIDVIYNFKQKTFSKEECDKNILIYIKELEHIELQIKREIKFKRIEKY